MVSRLRNLSATIYCNIDPAMLLATFLIDVYADISNNIPGLRVAAIYVAGPDPIDLPKRKISFDFHPISSTK